MGFLEEINGVEGLENTGIEEMLAILNIDDALFDQIYPEVRKGLLESYKEAEFQQILLDLVNSQSMESLEETFGGLLAKVEKDEELSHNKKDFLMVIFRGLLDGCKDKQKSPYIKIPIYLELCHPDAKIPTYATEGDSGTDVYAVEDFEIPVGGTIIAKTGLKVAIPRGYELQVRPRSGMSYKTKMRVANAPGTIDSGYRNEIGIICDNIGTEILFAKKGDRIAQLVLQEVPRAEFIVVDSVADIGEDRGGGFGHTGR